MEDLVATSSVRNDKLILESVGPRSSFPIDASQTATSTRLLLSDKAILVVEDEPLIGLDIVSTLERAGARVSGPVGTEKAAIALIERDHFDAALLDANLHGRSVDAIAATLNRRAIPFLFVTGYGKEGLPEAFKQTVTLSKPFSDRQLIDAVVKLNLPQTNVLRLKRCISCELACGARCGWRRMTTFPSASMPWT
jgi:CheY-like chemotaxis protein